MSFLAAQIQCVRSISMVDFFPQIVKVAQKSGPSQNKDWASTHATLTHALLLGDTLIRRHSRPFNLQKFYTAAEAQHGVEIICAALKAFVEGWSLEGVEVDDRVPPAVVNDDRSTLHGVLGYVLYGEDHDFGDALAAVRREWRECQEPHTARLTRFRIVPDEEVDEEVEMGTSISGSVYRSGGLALKLDFLRQAAQGLAKVYACKFIHRDISTWQFIVFPLGTVKIAGFASATGANIMGLVTVRT
eukprot:evm.model.scf_1546.3 EVM.evm.TU.scf_1546.3   scf_1546:21090-25134(+)